MLEASKNYRLEECVIDSLMRLDSNPTNCTECQYVLCDIDMVIRIDEETYACEKCALVDTVSRNVGCPLIIKENLKGVE